MIGYVEIECMIYHTQSLKEKRSVLKKVKNKIRSDLNVAISEMDYHDLWQRTCLGIVTVSRDKIHSEKVLQKSIRLLESFPELEATATRFEWL